MKKNLLVALVLLIATFSASASVDFPSEKIGFYTGSPFNSSDLFKATLRQVRITTDINAKYSSIYVTFNQGSLEPNSYSISCAKTMLDSIVVVGGTPVIICNPMSGLSVINNGSLDSYLTNFAAWLATRYDTEILISFGPEMNGGWHSWGQKAVEYKKAFVRVAGLFKKANAKIKMCWVPNWAKGYPWGTTSLDPAGAYSDYYPGDDVVDYVGLNFYYKDWEMEDKVPDWFWHGERSCLGHTKFYDTFCVDHNKPMIITENSGVDLNYNKEGSSTRVPLDSIQQAEFKRQYVCGMSQLMNEHPLLQIVIFFYTVKKEPAEDSTHKFGAIETDYRLNFRVDCTVDVADNKIPQPDAMVYPNPCFSVFSIDNLPKNEEATIQIFNLYGNVVLTNKIFGKSGSIDLSTAPAGVYWCKITTKETSQIIKIVHF